MEPVEGPTKICPECHNSVFESETVCGFCGHVFAEEHVAAAQPPTVATKVCPVCKAPVPAADTKCGICGHVFSAEAIAKAQSWPQTYGYDKWGSKGVYTSVTVLGVIFALIIIGLLYASQAAKNGPPLPVAMAIAGFFLLLIAGLAVAASMQASNSSVTLYGDHIEWTTSGGKSVSIKNTELSFGTLFNTKNGKGYTFGVENGPSRSIIDNLDGFDEVVAEIESRLGR